MDEQIDEQITTQDEPEVNVLFPHAVSQLENDLDFQTKDEVEAMVGSEATLRENADGALSDRIDGKQNTLTAGTNITIADDTISGSPLYASPGQNTDGAMTQKATSAAISNEVTARENGDNNLQVQIDAISASSDVADVVGTYAALQSYDTSKLTDKAIIKVLADENESGATTYYRWSTTSETFTLIGSEGPYYTKTQSDTLIGEKLDKTTTFWGKTAQNGEVSGSIALGSASSAPNVTADGTNATAGMRLTSVATTLQRALNGAGRVSLRDNEVVINVPISLSGDGVNHQIKHMADGTDPQDAVTKAQLDTKQDALSAGANISISGNTISVNIPPTSDSAFGLIKSSVTTVLLIAESAYNALPEKDPNTLYLIQEGV